MIWLLVDSSSVGGIERHIATLAAALTRRAIATRIVLLQDHGDNPWLTQLQHQGLTYQVLRGGLQGLLATIAHDKPQLIHTHGYKANILGRIAAKWHGVPIASTFHAGERGTFPVNVYQTLDEWTSILSERLVVSEQIRQHLPYASRLALNFLSVPPGARVSPLPRRIAFVGRLSHEKGPDRFCRIAEAIGDRFEWHVYGDGPMRHELEQAFGGHVTFHGLVLNLDDVWSTTGLVLMPSRAEGLPMAALESLAAGVPILATSVGGLPTVVRESKTGWLFNGSSIAEAREKIAAWASLDAEQQRAMRSACWTLVHKGYSEDAQLPTILAAYEAAGLKLAPERPRAA